MYECGIHLRTEFGEFSQQRIWSGLALSNHSASSPGSLASGLMLFKHGDGRTRATQFESERQPDNASADDDYVRCLHHFILLIAVEEILDSSLLRAQHPAAFTF